jgi:large subunit ribosomal protein L15
MKLHDVHQGIVRRRRRTRVGRGIGSGQGKTAAKGHKGQRARAGWKALPIFQGGTMPLVRRVPKRGFHNKFAREVAEVNVAQLERLFQDGDDVNPETLRARGCAKQPHDEIKILGNGDLTRKLKVAAHRFSESAREKITQAGGEVTVIPGPRPVVRNKMKAKK